MQAALIKERSMESLIKINDLVAQYNAILKEQKQRTTAQNAPMDRGLQLMIYLTRRCKLMDKLMEVSAEYIDKELSDGILATVLQKTMDMWTL